MEEIERLSICDFDSDLTDKYKFCYEEMALRSFGSGPIIWKVE